MAHPDIARKIAASHENITVIELEHAAAMLMPPGNDAHLGAAITRLLQDPGARKRLALESERAATGPFSWDRIAEQTRRLYEQLVTQSSNDGNRHP